MGTEFQFHSWRVFVLVAALPAIASLVGLTFMPESPRFLLEVRLLPCEPDVFTVVKLFTLVFRLHCSSNPVWILRQAGSSQFK